MQDPLQVPIPIGKVLHVDVEALLVEPHYLEQTSLLDRRLDDTARAEVLLPVWIDGGAALPALLMGDALGVVMPGGAGPPDVVQPGLRRRRRPRPPPAAQELAGTLDRRAGENEPGARRVPSDPRAVSRRPRQGLGQPRRPNGLSEGFANNGGRHDK